MAKLPSAEELDEELQTVGTQEKALELVHAYARAVLEAATKVLQDRLNILEQKRKLSFNDGIRYVEVEELLAEVRKLKEEL